ncbi:MAG: tRNA lysidine(34) synthetase TilS [Treponema sp.]|nr:tRNA lysidine(34) synthetase TilS [Treponema sp.]
MCLAAVSGGADSAAMLVALAALGNAPGAVFTLRCLHVEHGIRPPEESREDAAFVRELCVKLAIPCKMVSVAPGKIAVTAKRRGIGIEAAARLYRHRALLKEARVIEAESAAPVRILIAHTRDDALETALMRVLRGAGPAGLAAMPAKRGRILRPLLALGRADVLRYLGETNIPWREDSTNADTRFLRSRIRRRLIPFLDECFPHWQKGLAALAETQALAAAFIDGETGRVNWTAAGSRTLGTDAQNFFAQAAIVREEALFRGIDRLLAGTFPVPVKRAGLRRFCGELTKAADLGPVWVRREEGRVVVSLKKPRTVESGFSLLIKAPGLYTLRKTAIVVKPCSEKAAEITGGFYALLPLALRRNCKGDCIGGKRAPPEWGRRTLSAVDRLGAAAFIGPEGTLRCREVPQDAAGEKFCAVTVRPGALRGREPPQRGEAEERRRRSGVRGEASPLMNFIL